MGVLTIEGYVENGQIRVPQDARLPERARVFIVIPDTTEVFDVKIPNEVVHFCSPRLANPKQLKDFRIAMKALPK